MFRACVARRTRSHHSDRRRIRTIADTGGSVFAALAPPGQLDRVVGGPRYRRTQAVSPTPINAYNSQIVAWLDWSAVFVAATGSDGVRALPVRRPSPPVLALALRPGRARRRKDCTCLCRLTRRAASSPPFRTRVNITPAVGSTTASPTCGATFSPGRGIWRDCLRFAPQPSTRNQPNRCVSQSTDAQTSSRPPWFKSATSLTND